MTERKAGDSLRRYGDELSKSETRRFYEDSVFGIGTAPERTIDRGPEVLPAGWQEESVLTEMLLAAL